MSFRLLSKSGARLARTFCRTVLDRCKEFCDKRIEIDKENVYYLLLLYLIIFINVYYIFLQHVLQEYGKIYKREESNCKSVPADNQQNKWGRRKTLIKVRNENNIKWISTVTNALLVIIIDFKWIHWLLGYSIEYIISTTACNFRIIYLFRVQFHRTNYGKFKLLNRLLLSANNSVNYLDFSRLPLLSVAYSRTFCKFFFSFL